MGCNRPSAGFFGDALMPWVALAASLLSRIGMGARLLLATFPPSAEPSPVDRVVGVFGLKGFAR